MEPIASVWLQSPLLWHRTHLLTERKPGVAGPHVPGRTAHTVSKHIFANIHFHPFSLLPCIVHLLRQFSLSDNPAL